MSTELFDKIKTEWKKLYKQHMKLDYVPDASDNKAIGMIISKIRQLKPEYDSTQMFEAVTWYFKNCFEFAPKWILENIDLKLINSKFNSLRKHINSSNPAKKYAEQNYSNNYNKYGNKKVIYNKGDTVNLTEIIQNFQIDK